MFFSRVAVFQIHRIHKQCTSYQCHNPAVKGSFVLKQNCRSEFPFCCKLRRMLYLFSVTDASTTQPRPVDKKIQKFIAHLDTDRGVARIPISNPNLKLDSLAEMVHISPSAHP